MQVGRVVVVVVSVLVLVLELKMKQTRPQQLEIMESGELKFDTLSGR